MTLRYETGKFARWAFNAIRSRKLSPEEIPESYRVVAFMPTYNEADIIETTLRRLAESGVEVYVLDNWSNDGTWELVHKNASGNLIGAERNPTSGSAATYDL